MYGGSTTWGIDQRDEHTIPSELARVAHEHGLTVDVENRGLTGINHWLESERFALDLTSGERPDLVVFYDGVNEIYMANGNSGLRRTDEAPLNPALMSLWDGAMSREADDDDVVDGPPGSEIIDTSDTLTGPVRTALDIVDRYDRAREMSRRTAAHAGIPVAYIWQPSRYSRPLVLSEPHWDAQQENTMRLENQVTSDHMASDVIDLSDAFDDVSGPIFTDDVHHDEQGARVMAEAMFASLEAQLVALAG
jgi:lysophospholipase L1-like esterase